MLIMLAMSLILRTHDLLLQLGSPTSTCGYLESVQHVMNYISLCLKRVLIVAVFPQFAVSGERSASKRTPLFRHSLLQNLCTSRDRQ